MSIFCQPGSPRKLGRERPRCQVAGHLGRVSLDAVLVVKFPDSTERERVSERLVLTMFRRG